MLYENWKEAISGKPLRETLEFPIYGDARLTSHIEFDKKGPYWGFNTLPNSEPGTLANTLIFRANIHLLDEDRITDIVTNVDRYHGGSIEDDFSSLLSLTLGARFQAGSVNRLFEPDGDPKGQPTNFGFRRNPTLPTLMSRDRRLPAFIEEKSLLAARSYYYNFTYTPSGSSHNAYKGR